MSTLTSRAFQPRRKTCFSNQTRRPSAPSLLGLGSAQGLGFSVKVRVGLGRERFETEVQLQYCWCVWSKDLKGVGVHTIQMRMQDRVHIMRASASNKRPSVLAEGGKKAEVCSEHHKHRTVKRCRLEAGVAADCWAERLSFTAKESEKAEFCRQYRKDSMIGL